MRFDEVASTQDVARQHLAVLPVVVIAHSQTRGRGRTAAHWLNADVALAVSVAFRATSSEKRPLSLVAGVAAVRIADRSSLKWPNDVLVGDDKVGGILVERNEDSIVIGMGLNLFWPDAPEGMGALFEENPGDRAVEETAALWAAELMDLIHGPGWPIEEYRADCVTLGEEITWEPGGSGRAVDVDREGALLVDTATGRFRVVAGEVRHVRRV